MSHRACAFYDEQLPLGSVAVPELVEITPNNIDVVRRFRIRSPWMSKPVFEEVTRYLVRRVPQDKQDSLLAAIFPPAPHTHRNREYFLASYEDDVSGGVLVGATKFGIQLSQAQNADFVLRPVIDAFVPDSPAARDGLIQGITEIVVRHLGNAANFMINNRAPCSTALRLDELAVSPEFTSVSDAQRLRARLHQHIADWVTRSKRQWPSIPFPFLSA